MLALALVGAFLAGAGAVGAQGRAVGGGRPTGTRPTVDPTADPTATGPADTAMRPGRADFSGYTTPGMCLAAAQQLDRAWRLADPDTIAFHPERDTVGTATVALARRCGARFAAATVAPDGLLDLVHLALLAGDDATAQQAADRYVMTRTDTAERRWALYDVDTTYLYARPERLAAAETAVVRLDALGPPAALQRVAAHHAHAMQAEQRADLPRIERAALGVIAAHNQLGPDSPALPAEGGWANVIGSVLFAEVYRNPRTALAETERRMIAAGLREDDWTKVLTVAHWQRLDWGLAQSGTRLKPLTADRWVAPDSGRQTWPVPGKVSVLIHGQVMLPGWRTAYDSPTRFAMWKRLAKKYGQAVNFTVLVRTSGSFLDGPPLALDEEAARLGQFYREELGVPVTVAVQATPVKQLPDGRQIREMAPFESDPYYRSSHLLADRNGTLLLLLPNHALSEAWWDAWLARATGQGAEH